MREKFHMFHLYMKKQKKTYWYSKDYVGYKFLVAENS